LGRHRLITITAPPGRSAGWGIRHEEHDDETTCPGRLVRPFVVRDGGCQSKEREFPDWHDELAYLRAQASPTRAQFARRQELSVKAIEEEVTRVGALQAKAQEEQAKGLFERAQGLENGSLESAQEVYEYLRTEYSKSPWAAKAKDREAIVIQKLADQRAKGKR
jgi:hypothetical protein